MALAFECAKELFYLLHPALDTSGFADFSGATQGARLLGQFFAVARCPRKYASVFLGAGCSFGVCSHGSAPLFTGQHHRDLGNHTPIGTRCHADTFWLRPSV